MEKQNDKSVPPCAPDGVERGVGERPWEAGPWRLEVKDEGKGNQTCWILAAKDLTVNCSDMTTGKVFSTTQPSYMMRSGTGVYAGRSCKTDLSNFKLAAAAPELYEALNGFMNLFSPDEVALMDYRKAWERGRAALAKANPAMQSPQNPELPKTGTQAQDEKGVS